MYIKIDDETEDEIKMSIDLELVEIYPWVVLNLDEIGTTIACNLFYESSYEQVNQEILDEQINDFLSEIHDRIFEKATEKLYENGIDVI